MVWMFRLSRPLSISAEPLNATSDLMFRFSMLLTPLIAASIALISTLSLPPPFFCTVKFSVSLPALPSRVSRDDRVDVLVPLPT